ncbi:hypothetical protein SUGI_1130060 [Cryptomeria japonica]|uniref:F-box/kelch-repeat protein SKIP11-like n=1 Tax=Cryptomeria japonica TaxID=3369 RepID=UPI0024148144|nr:F-box/kelch-repeat protein SKIP11-like [Cryptomeria japonica]GLJ53049.1 hypothetical protein SUGI_1130060 [Cryptomeria japonica]
MDFLQEIPEETFRDILLRVPYKSQSKIKQLLEPAKEIMECSQFYQDRAKFGLLKQYICVLKPGSISIYDPIDQTCVQIAPLPKGFQTSPSTQTVSVNHKIVLLWLEHNHDSDSRRILIYDLLTSTWKQGAKMPTPTSYFTSFTCCPSPQGSIYIAEGEPMYGIDKLRGAAVYKVDKDMWELLPKMQEGIRMSKSVFIEGMFYVIDLSNHRIQRFNPNTKVWTTIENISEGVEYVNVLYAFGRLIATTLSKIYEYDWEENVWKELETLAQHLWFAHATVWCDRIFFMRRNNLSGPPVFYMYKPGAALSDRWISVAKPKKFKENKVKCITTIEI